MRHHASEQAASHATAGATACRPEGPDVAGERRLAAHIISASATLVGVCLTVTGALWVVNKLQGLDTIADTALAIDALMSTLACGLAYASLRAQRESTAQRLEHAADVAFLTALVLMSAACGIIAYKTI